jgi:hypothetical protein
VCPRVTVILLWWPSDRARGGHGMARCVIFARHMSGSGLQTVTAVTSVLVMTWANVTVLTSGVALVPRISRDAGHVVLAVRLCVY